MQSERKRCKWGSPYITSVYNDSSFWVVVKLEFEENILFCKETNIRPRSLDAQSACQTGVKGGRKLNGRRASIKNRGDVDGIGSIGTSIGVGADHNRGPWYSIESLIGRTGQHRDT